MLGFIHRILLRYWSNEELENLIKFATDLKKEQKYLRREIDLSIKEIEKELKRRQTQKELFDKYNKK